MRHRDFRPLVPGLGRHREVYFVLGYSGIVLSVALASLAMSGGLEGALSGGMVGALVFGAFHVLGRVPYRGREPLGTGDVTIAALLGAMTGFPGVLTALGVGILAGGIGAVLILARSGSRTAYIPYGPALCPVGLFVPSTYAHRLGATAYYRRRERAHNISGALR